MTRLQIDDLSKVRRTVSLGYSEPWLFGWCRWTVATDLYEGDRHVRREVLAAGRWRWRGQRACAFLGVIDCDTYWKGPIPR